MDTWGWGEIKWVQNYFESDKVLKLDCGDSCTIIHLLRGIELYTQSK